MSHESKYFQVLETGDVFFQDKFKYAMDKTVGHDPTDNFCVAFTVRAVYIHAVLGRFSSLKDRLEEGDIPFAGLLSIYDIKVIP